MRQPSPPQRNSTTPAIYLLFAVPAIGAAFGVHYLVKHYQPSHVAKVETTEHGGRKVASTGKADRDTNLGDRPAKHPKKASGESHAAIDSDEEEGEAIAADSSVAPEAVHAAAPSPEAWATNEQVQASAPADGSCAQVEYPGAGPTHTQITKADWGRVMTQFHDAKARLAQWLRKHKGELSPQTFAAMERQTGALRIQRPPSAEEPDLAWRGIGVLSQTAEGEPLIKVGGGFVELARQNPTRARFELTRLAAQAWAPCELQKIAGVVPAWNPLLKCLGYGEENQACGLGTFSDAGWAVSSTVAYTVSHPGCKLPVFQKAEIAACATHIPFAHEKTEHHAARPLPVLYKEARL